ncbi:MAG: response regulator, partial [Acidobacteriota bacterium]
GQRTMRYRHADIEASSLGDDLVTALYEDSEGVLWVGTDAGLDRFDGAGGFDHLLGAGASTEGSAEERVNALFDGADGDLWVGTDHGGLLRLDTVSGHFERFDNDPQDSTSLSNNRVLALYRGASGEVWVGTSKGLNKLLPDGTFRRYLEQDGLSDALVATLLGDSAGRLWIGTPSGLSRFDPASGVFRDYYERDGLQPGGFYPGAAVTRHNGRLCFGGINGFNCFDPKQVVDNPHAPPVVLTGFETFGERVEFGRSTWAVESIRLTHEDNFFAFELAALDFTDPSANRYRYQLEGYDLDWVDADSGRLASYTNVAPGEYVFRARGANSDGVWSEDGPNIALSIKPPFWQTSGFRALLAVGLLSLAGVVYHYRIRHLRRREQKLSRRLDERMADLRRSEERYRLLFERNLAGVVRATPVGSIIDCNEAFAKIFGYASPAECQAKHRLALDLSPGSGTPGSLSPAAQPSLLARLRAEGAVVGHEASALTGDGSVVSLLWNANMISEAGQPSVIEGTVIDVSERQRIEEGLRRAQKLESLGVLAGGIAHDFNNLLMSILGNAELGRMGLDRASKIHGRLEKIETAAQRASELASKMLAYSGKGEFVVSRIDLASTVRGMAHLLEGAVPKKASLVFELQGGLPLVEADVEQIEQIVTSLVTNASEALGGAEGAITVGCAVRDYSAEELADTYLDDRLPAGFYVSLTVRDTGSGMDEDLQLKIFDPFFTTKFTGRGLGLAAVLGIVRGHRGAIKIDSTPGRGSLFTVLFPAAEEQSSTTVDVPTIAVETSGQSIVLVVDDDEAVRHVARDMVEALGFDVLTANDGLEGLEMYRQHADQIGLVILDLAMPKMSGEEAFHAIREISPSARVILASGYDEGESTRLFAGQGLSGFIQKPYRMLKLREKIEDVLGPGAASG